MFRESVGASMMHRYRRVKAGQGRGPCISFMYIYKCMYCISRHECTYIGTPLAGGQIYFDGHLDPLRQESLVFQEFVCFWVQVPMPQRLVGCEVEGL